MLAFLSQFTGVPALPIVSNQIFAKEPNIPTILATYLVSVAGAIGASIGPFLQKLMKIKTLLSIGYCLMAGCQLIIVVTNAVKKQEATLIFIVFLQLFYQMTAGTYTFGYIAAVSNEAQVAAANCVIWTMLLLVQTLLLIDTLSISVNFTFFCVSTTCGIFYTFWRVKPTEGLSSHQMKQIYFEANENLLDNSSLVMEDCLQ